MKWLFMESLGKVDVIMCTWNSNKPWFKIVLHSIRREIPICHFIVVDRFSNDGTQRIVKEIFPEAIIIESDLNLGRARAEAIKHVDTALLIFIDDDIELPTGWFNKVIKYLDSETGAVQGQAMLTLSCLQKFYEWSSRWIAKRKGRVNIKEITSKNPDEMRGYTNNTLLRTYLIKDWSPPSYICAYEDHLILRHIVKKGYTWKIVLNLIVKHYGIFSLKDYLRKSRWNTAGARLIRFNDLSLLTLIKTLTKGMVKAFFASIKTREPMIIPYILIGQLGYIQGWIGWSKYVVMKR